MTQPFETPPPDSAQNPYRTGYREGFRDGYGEARNGAHAEQDRTKTEDCDDQANRVKAGGAQGGGKGDGDKKDDAKKDADERGGEKEGGKDDKNKGGDKDTKPLYKRPVLVMVVLLVLLAAIIAGIYFWRQSRRHASTDDAFVDGQTSQIAAQTSGRVIKLHVSDNQHVDVGDPLIDIDPRDNAARTDQARAQVANAESQSEQARARVEVQRAAASQSQSTVRQSEVELDRVTRDLARYKSVDPAAVAPQQVDAADAAVRSARAQLAASRASARAAQAQITAALAEVGTARTTAEAARASLAAAELQGSYTHVVAPLAGRVTRRSVDIGNVVSTGQALMAVVSDSLWVTANYKETQLTRMAPGQAVEITVDAFPDQSFRGHVDSIQRGTGAYFSMLPAENATGNYVKVVQRVPVKILFDDEHVRNFPIGPGMSVTPVVTLP